MAVHSKKLWFVLLYFTCTSFVRTDETIISQLSSESVFGKQENINTNTVALFEKLFQLKRSEQKDAVHRILAIKSVEKQNKLLKLVITKIMEVLAQSRVNLESSGYHPGSGFPIGESLRDALSSMSENTAFMGDLVLYLPDATKAFLKDNEWSTIFKWSLSLCQEADFLGKNTKKMLHLVAQELNLIEREPGYFNPHAEVNRRKPVDLPEIPEKKKARKKISKGPSLSGARLKSEL